jgi:hypothetical protein
MAFTSEQNSKEPNIPVRCRLLTRLVTPPKHRLQLEMQQPDQVRENLLLSALPLKERERLAPFLQPVTLRVGYPITEPDEPITAVYFMHDAVTSTIQEMSDGSSIRIG